MVPEGVLSADKTDLMQHVEQGCAAEVSPRTKELSSGPPMEANNDAQGEKESA